MRGKQYTKREQETIISLHLYGYSVRKIANIMKRGKSGIQGQIEKLRAEGRIAAVSDEGRSDENQ